MDSEPSVNGFGIRYSFPAILAPVNGCGCEHFDSQISSNWDCPNLLVKPPRCEFGASLLCLISNNGLWRHVEDFSLPDGSREFDVLRVRPDERHRCTVGPAVVNASVGHFLCIPNL